MVSSLNLKKPKKLRGIHTQREKGDLMNLLVFFFFKMRNVGYKLSIEI
jgi:hypothetical protein